MNDVVDGVPDHVREGANLGENGAVQCNIEGECDTVVWM